MKNGIFLGTDSDNKKQHLLLPLANRHGLITGSTGTGKTVTMQILCEGFSKAGVPVFAADVKGDLSGVSQAGSVANMITHPCQRYSGIFTAKKATPFAPQFQKWDQRFLLALWD